MLAVVDARTATGHFPGIGRYVANLVAALAKVAPAGKLALLQPAAADLPTRAALPGVQRLVCAASPFSWRQQWTVPAALRRAGATLYHSPYYLMPYWPGVRTVLTCYDLIPLLYPQYYGLGQRLVYRLALGRALAAAHTVLAISQATRADLARHYRVDPARIAVAPLAAGPGFCPQPAAAIEAMRRRYGLPPDYALYLGSNKPHKNLPRLVRAWATATAALAGGQPAFRLVIAGRWDQRYPEARQEAERLRLRDDVLFAGPIPEEDLAALYSGAGLFVFPSLYEGFGLPVLEAMACGTPVICSNSSSLPEVAGQAALTFDPMQETQMAATLMQALRDRELRRDLAGRGLSRAAAFSWQRCARETWAAYQAG